MSDFEKYLDLIQRVAEVDIKAALYLRHEAQELTGFEPSGLLTCCFIFSETPQGHRFWFDLNYKLLDMM